MFPALLCVLLDQHLLDQRRSPERLAAFDSTAGTHSALGHPVRRSDERRHQAVVLHALRPQAAA